MMKKISSLLLVILLFLVNFTSVNADSTLILPGKVVLPGNLILYRAPAAPSGLTSGIYNGSLVNLTWIDNSSNEESFTVQRAESGGSYEDIATGVTYPSMSDYNAVRGKAYIYRVKAVNSIWGDSAYSNETTIVLPLQGPTDLKVTADKGIVSLTWADNSSAEEHFVIERVASGGPFVELATTTANTTQYKDADIIAGLGYTYRIYAGNVTVESDFSNEASIIIPAAATVPAAPTNFKATVAGTNVSLTWVDNSNNEKQFTIERKESGGSYTAICGIATDATGWTDSSVTAGKTYVYRVYAEDNNYITSTYSNEVTVAIPAMLVLPVLPPTELGATVSAGIVGLNWKDNSSNEQGFTVERKEAGGSFAYVNGASAGMTTLVDNSVVAGKTYVYRAKAINSSLGDSIYSNEATITIPGSVVAAPTDLKATKQEASISFTWKDNSSNEDQFMIQRKEKGNSYINLASVAANQTAYTDKTPIDGITYLYRIKAVSTTLGESLYSNELTISLSQATVDYSSASSWAIPEIQAAIGYKLTTDSVLTGFSNKITREEFCEIAVKLYEAISGQTAQPAANPFNDTTNSEILKAYKLGIVKGITQNSFAPDNAITRQEISVMLLRALKEAKPNGDYSITGAPVIADEKEIATWAMESVKYMNKAGIMNGTGGNNISPKGNTTKEQAIALIKRMFEKYN